MDSIDNNSESPGESGDLEYGTELIGVCGDRWRVLGQVGEDGRAIIYRCRRPGDPGLYTLKISHPGGNLDHIYLKREFEVLAASQHANFLRAWDEGRHDERQFITVDWAPFNLEERFERQLGTFRFPSTPWPWKDVFTVLAGVVRALLTLHRDGLYHRDVRPASIRFADPRRGRPLLANCGLVSRPIEAVEKRTLVMSGDSGRAHASFYIPPWDRDLKPGDYGKRDVYALAVMMHSMLSAEPPFRVTSEGVFAHQEPNSISSELIGEDAVLIPPELANALRTILRAEKPGDATISLDYMHQLFIDFEPPGLDEECVRSEGTPQLPGAASAPPVRYSAPATGSTARVSLPPAPGATARLNPQNLPFTRRPPAASAPPPIIPPPPASSRPPESRPPSTPLSSHGVTEQRIRPGGLPPTARATGRIPTRDREGLTLPGFTWIRRERFKSANVSFEVAIYRNESIAHALKLRAHQLHSIESEFVLIPGGSMLMGSPDDEEGRFPFEGPVHEVQVAQFLIARCPITTRVWSGLCAKAGLNDTAQLQSQPIDSAPVEFVSYDEAAAFARGINLRLPTEAEWEYACRAGTVTAFWFGDDGNALINHGWFNGNSDGVLHEVGKKPCNPFGLHEMHGSVWEWCQDDWHESYKGAPKDSSPWRSAGAPGHVYRGGNYTLGARACRSALRSWGASRESKRGIGLRLAFDAIST